MKETETNKMKKQKKQKKDTRFLRQKKKNEMENRQWNKMKKNEKKKKTSKNKENKKNKKKKNYNLTRVSLIYSLRASKTFIVYLSPIWWPTKIFFRLNWSGGCCWCKVDSKK